MLWDIVDCSLLERALISFCNWAKASALPFLYISGMYTLKIPSSEYTMSSSRFVWRLPTYDMRSSTLNWSREIPRRASALIPVMLWSSRTNVYLLPSRSPSTEKNSTDVGANNSWSVQPRVNHLLCWNAGYQSCQTRLAPVRLLVETSDRYT